MKFTDPSTGVVVECTPAEYAELQGLKPIRTAEHTEASNDGSSRPLDRKPRPSNLTRGQMETWEALDAYRKEGLSTTGLSQILGINAMAASQRVGALRRAGIQIHSPMQGLYYLKD